jgi:ABC-2 type transport system permease protein
MNKIFTIVEKEWADVFRHRLVLFTVVLLPVMMIVLPVIMITLSSNEAIAKQMSDLPPGYVERLNTSGLSMQATIQAFIGQMFNLLFLIVPLAIPITIASYSVVGEKNEGSLEPLLATPISTSELLASKSIAAAVPGVVGAWIASLIYAILLLFLVPDTQLRGLLLSPQWLFGILILVPLLTVLASTTGLIISSRVNDARVAEQLGALIVLPVVGLLIAQMAGVILFDMTIATITAVILLVIDYGLLMLAVRLFNRETILTRWK